MQENLKTISAYTERTDLIFKTFKKNYSSLDTVPLSLLIFCVQVGEGRACWSLGNAHSAMGDPEKAYHYAARHLQISKETGDRMGQATAQVKNYLSSIIGQDNQCCGSCIRNPVLFF
jgi:hypothetical protein